MRLARSTRIELWLMLAIAHAGGGCGTKIAQTAAEPVKGRARDAGSNCGALADRVHVTSFDTGSMVMANDEWHPVVIAPRQTAGERGAFVAWRAAADNKILLATLDSDDQPTNKSFQSFAGTEVHSLLAPDDVGGTLVIVSDDAEIYSSDYCISTATPNNPAHCQKLELVRFDEAGQISWRTSLTNKIPVSSEGAVFIWSKFEHTARVSWNGTWYGVYFRSASSFANRNTATGIEMQPTDTLRFVDQDGAMLADGGWDTGCTNSWSVRLAYDGHFLAACHGNPTPNAMRLAIVEPIANSTPKTSQLLPNTDPYRRALGGLVPNSSGFWLDYIANDSSTLRLHLGWVTDAAASSRDRVIDAAKNLAANYPFRPYMASYGAGQLLLGYKTTAGLSLAIADAATGDLIEGPVATTAPIDQFQDFVGDSNGDVLWAYSDGSSSRIQVVRVAACR